MDRPIRHCGYYPSWNLRLFKRGTARYEERAVHEHMLLEGRAGYIREPMIHWDRRGLDYYTSKHNEYSTLEAMALLEDSNERFPQAWKLPGWLSGREVSALTGSVG